MNWIEWRERECPVEFQNRIRSRQDSVTALVIDEAFVRNFLGLHDADLNETISALKANVFTTLYLDALPEMSDQSSAARFQMLCATLGSMKQMTTVSTGDMPRFPYSPSPPILNTAHVAVF
jgi:hypothetical protein